MLLYQAHIFQEVEQGKVNLENRLITLTLEPKLFGGYETGNDSLQLTSAFQETTVEIHLAPKKPLAIQGTTEAVVTVQPLSVSLGPQQSAPLNFTFEVEGEHPSDGRIHGVFALNFADKKNRVYPSKGEFEIFLKSWWEMYGFLVAVLVALALGGLGLMAWLIRKAQVPEIRITVSDGTKTIGPPITLKIKHTFKFANDDFTGNAVPVKALNCKTAATVKYLGRRKFEIKSEEATIVDEGKERQRLEVKLDQYFDLKDSAGKTLHGLSITTPGSASSGDPFGGGGGDVF